MPCKRKLLARGEDPDPVIGARVGGQQEDGLGQVGPGGEGLHRRRIHGFGIEDDAERIAGARRCREHVQLEITTRRGRRHDDGSSKRTPVSQADRASSTSGRGDAPATD
jgi:hypothetical protein